MKWKPLKGEGSGSEPRPLAASLDQFVSRFALPSPDQLRAVISGWDELVGRPLCLHVKPVALRAGELMLDVDAPGWATQVRYLEGDLIDRCNQAAGKGTVVRINVRVRPPRVLD